MNIEEQGLWWKCNTPNGDILIRHKSPENLEGFSLEEAESILPQVIKVAEKYRHIPKMFHVLVNVGEENFYVMMNSSFVQLPYLTDDSYGRTSDKSKIFEFNPPK